jgi:hypothetical protein
MYSSLSLESEVLINRVPSYRADVFEAAQELFKQYT